MQTDGWDNNLGGSLSPGVRRPCLGAGKHANTTDSTGDNNTQTESATKKETCKNPIGPMNYEGNEEGWCLFEKNRQEGRIPENEDNEKNERNKACFNYSQYRRVMNDMELEVFFVQNEIPALDVYPDVHRIRDPFIVMNDRLYKRTKERIEARAEAAGEGYQLPKIRKIYMDAFDSKRKMTKRQRRKVNRAVKMYTRSQAIANLFRSYYSLVDHHHSVFSTYPVLKKMYYRVIFTIFGSIRRKCVMEMIGEISNSTKMYMFFKDLYLTWEHETDKIEKREVIRHI